MADAMYAPVCTRFLTYDVKLDPKCAAYCRSIMELAGHGASGWRTPRPSPPSWRSSTSSSERARSA